MRAFYKSFDFSLLGTLPGQETIIGRIHDKSGQLKTVAITLTDQLGPTARKTKILSIRNEIAPPADHAPPSHGVRGWLPFSFAQSAKHAPPAHMTAKIAEAKFVPETVEMILEQQDRTHIIFDCQTKESFWSMCRYLDIDDATSFSLAELDALKPHPIEIHQPKSAGNAHILATWLSRQKSPVARELLTQIQTSVKFKLPDFNQTQNRLSAVFEEEFSKLEKQREALKHPLAKALQWVNKKLAPTESVFSREAFDQTFRDTWKARTGLTPEDVHFASPITEMAQDADGQIFEKFRLKPGIYNLPYQRCLFELDVTRDEDSQGPAERFHFYLLAQQMDQAVRFMPIMLKDGESEYMFGRFYDLNIAVGQKLDWQVLDNKHGQIEVQEHGLDYNIYSCAIVSSLNVVARMNEPDYEPKTVTPTAGQVNKSMGRAPYYQYHVVEDYPELYRSRQVSGAENTKGDGSCGSVIRHLVRGYPRRIRNEDGSVDLIIISPYARGDANKGFKMRGYDFSGPERK